VNILVCPTDVVRAPIEVVWRTLTEGYAEWVDGEVAAVEPPGPAAPGQSIEILARGFGRRFRVRMEMGAVDAARHRLPVDVYLPLGIVNHELVTLDPTPDGATLVRFN
jgi:hypothetical protein